MPKLDWIGKNAVVRHHLEVPYRLVHCNGRISAGDADTGSLLVQGDNLEALKSLLPYYAGKVKCIYIDPPYNTGKEEWHYNDKVNSPQIRKWLDKVVGKEDEDLCRHDKWLCMMYPRMRLLREFLRRDGAIFVSVDDNEQHRLRMLMDEIFGSHHFVAQFIWHKKNVVQNDARFISVNHEYVLCYRRGSGLQGFNLSPRSDVAKARYQNPDNDPRGVWQDVALHAKSGDAKNVYSVKFPNGIEWTPPSGTYPKFSKKKILELYKEERLWFGKKGGNLPRLKKYLSEVREGMVANSILDVDEVGSTQTATETLKAVMQGDSVFSSPKPPGLVRRLMSFVAGKDDLIMDSFAGSGTTGHAVLQQNQEDGGNRRFILVEMDETIAEKITAKRIQTVIKGYEGKNKKYPPLGGGFRYCTLGNPLFDEHGHIAENVKFSDLAAHIYFSETGSPIPKRATNALLGVSGGCAIYLLYNGIMGDKSQDGGNVLTVKTLLQLPPHPDGENAPRVVYGESTTLSKEWQDRENVIFRQIPYQIQVR